MCTWWSSLAAVSAATALMLVFAGTASALPTGTTALIDRPTGFGPLPFDGAKDGSIGMHSLSADGRYVVFSGNSDALLATDEDSAENVYRLDRMTGALAQVNVTAAGAQPAPASLSDQPSISADGRFVAFFSLHGNLVPGAPPEGVYVKDMQTGSIELVSRGTGVGGEPATRLLDAVISGDGLHVAFTASGPLHADNADGVRNDADVYVRSLDTETTHMVSVKPAGGEGGGANATPDIDFHGDAVAFVTRRALVAEDQDTDGDAYARVGVGTPNEATVLLSFHGGQTDGADGAEQVALSGNGGLAAWSTGIDCCNGSLFMASLRPTVARATEIDVRRPGGTGASGGDPVFEPVASAGAPAPLLYFRSAARLDPADTNAFADLYSADVAHPGDGNFVHLKTSGAAGADVQRGSGAAGGSVVAFDSSASNLPGGDGIRTQVYVSAGGSTIDIVQPAGVPPRTSPAGDAMIQGLHAVSDDGRVVVFTSQAPVFAGAVRPAFAREVLARDIVTGRTTLVSVAARGAPADGDSFAPSVDASGTLVAFVSTATNLPGGANPDHRAHVYVRDLTTGTTTLVDRTAAGAPLSGGVGAEAVISPLGNRVAYVSASADAPGDPPGDTHEHVYVADLSPGGTTALADRAGDGSVADRPSNAPDMSGDGSIIAFTSAATNLGAGNPAGKMQVFLRDLSEHTTTWVSAGRDGSPQHSVAVQPSLDRSGTRVAFVESDPEFGFGMTGTQQVYVRDLGQSTPVLASRGTGGGPITGGLPSLSADGERVSFLNEPSSLTLADFQAWVRDLGAGTTTLVSANRGGAGARLGAFAASISGDGECVAFSSPSDDLVNPSYGPDFTHVFLRAVSTDCPGDLVPGVATGIGGGRKLRISGAHLTHRRFAVAARRTAVIAARRAPRGTSFVFTLSERARVTITIAHAVPGRRRRGRCVAPRHGLRTRCTRLIGLMTLTRARARAGRTVVAFSGRTGRTVLKPGRYRAALLARDAHGTRSRPVTLKFVVVRS